MANSKDLHKKECKRFTLFFENAPRRERTFCTNKLRQTTMDKNEKQDTNKPITFVLSDESVNSYGNVVLTEGIDTTAFERNPVMLYMHNRDGNVIGRWENIRKEDKRLLGDAVFDDSTELAATVKKQVEKGFCALYLSALK